MKYSKKGFLALLASSFLMVPLFAEYNSFDIPDSGEIRKQIADEWFFQDLDVIRSYNIQIRKNRIGENFQISLEEQNKQFIVYVSPKTSMQVDVYDNRGMHTVTEDSYPVNAFGSMMYVRNKEDGKPLYMRLYVSKNSDVYVQFRPHKNVTYADFVVFNAYAAQSVPLGISFEKILTSSISEIYSLTKNSLPWKYVKNFPDQYDSTLVMIQTLRACQSKIAYEDDAMYDEYGKSVSIINGAPHICDQKNEGKLILSSCGYVKWVVDGIVEPLAGSYLKRDPLLEPTVEYKETGFQGILNSTFSTNFSLDWTRNIAAGAFSVRAKKTYYYKDTGVDVKVEPFTAIFTDKGVTNTAGYIKNTGYKPDNLRAILYSLAVTEPEYFYLAAIRQTDRKSPEVKVFNDAAVIFPYIDNQGFFRVAVFMDGVEIKYDDFEKFLVRTKDCFVHLVRVKATKTFYPQEIKPLYK